ncbi:hypothetical protein CDAR_512171 [Caerostris darwini]|uniref:Uncharacterized protein n=1 Tax=Caerostris darwini TaxID=1538125 RepID=A0AAV4WGA1_9ARAC|nr:hypothetical protein CDAR_512171 [Caerostris darwini]
MQSLEKPNSEGESSQFRLICKGIVIMQSLETPNSEGESPQFRFLCKWIVIMQSLEMPNSEGESPQFRLICKGIAIMQSLETPNSKEKSSQFQFTCKRIVIMKNEKAFSHMHSLEMSNCKGQSSQFRLICKGIALSHMHSLETPNSKGQSSQFRFIRLLSIPSTTEPYKNPYLRHYFRNTSIENSWLIPEALFRACRQFLGNDLGDQIWVDSSKEVEFELHRSSADVYLAQLGRLHAAIETKRPHKKNRIAFHHDDARPLVERRVVECITNEGWELLPYPPYSPTEAPTDCHANRSLKHWPANKVYDDFDNLVADVKASIATKNSEFFGRGIDCLPSK